jgi:hypothetical protein
MSFTLARQLFLNTPTAEDRTSQSLGKDGTSMSRTGNHAISIRLRGSAPRPANQQWPATMRFSWPVTGSLQGGFDAGIGG